MYSWMPLNFWWLAWIAVMFIFLLAPVGYGWGIRGWGPPYPRYIQRRRADGAVRVGATSTVGHESWGWGGDFVWVMVLVGAIWALAVFWWH